MKQTWPWVGEHKQARGSYCVTGSRVPVEQHRPLVVVEGTVGSAEPKSAAAKKFHGAILPPCGVSRDCCQGQWDFCREADPESLYEDLDGIYRSEHPEQLQRARIAHSLQTEFMEVTNQGHLSFSDSLDRLALGALLSLLGQVTRG